MTKKLNKENSSIKQALLDLKTSGGDINAIDFLLQEIEQNELLREDADKLFQSHQYPEHSLNWCKLQGDIEFTRFLSPNAVVVLITMCQNMPTTNLIQVSCRDLIEITHISSPKAIQSAITELLDNGCITKMMKASGCRSAVYMVNPDIATVGKKIPSLKKLFWSKVKDCSADEDSQKKANGKKTKKKKDGKDSDSCPLTKWLSLTDQRTYHKGAEYWKDDSGNIRFSKINISAQREKSQVKKQAKTDGNEKTDSKGTAQQKNTSNIILFPEEKRAKEAIPEPCLGEGDEPLPFY